MSNCRNIELLPGALDRLHRVHGSLSAPWPEKSFKRLTDLYVGSALEVDLCFNIDINPISELVIGIAKEEANDPYYEPYDDLCESCLARALVNKLFLSENSKNILEEVIRRHKNTHNCFKPLIGTCYTCDALKTFERVIICCPDGVTYENMFKYLGIDI